MSLTLARMALQLAIQQSTKTTVVVYLSVSLSASGLFAQESSFKLREPGYQADLRPVVEQPNRQSSGLEAATVAQPNTMDLVSIRIPSNPIAQDAAVVPQEGIESTSDKKREPIRLPALLIPNTSIQEIGTRTTPEDLVEGRLPATIALPFGADRYGPWAIGTRTWIAPVYCHQPTYLEDTMLENHGHEQFPCIQPLVSGARFYSGIAFMPYLSYLNPPLRYSPSYDHYRPGSVAPALRQRAPYDKGALRFQLLTTGTTILAGQP